MIENIENFEDEFVREIDEQILKFMKEQADKYERDNPVELLELGQTINENT